MVFDKTKVWHALIWNGEKQMKTSLKLLTLGIPLMFASFAGNAAAANEILEHKLISCGGGTKKIVNVTSGQIVEIFEVVLSSSDDSIVTLQLGGKRIMRYFMAANANFQSSLLGIEGEAGQNIQVGCTGNGQVAVDIVFKFSAAP